ncbi:MAG: DUF6443 domain-containing protein [Haliscomenobacter sp.]|uniref:DUF6443 domain-containing protein n=1 Tax=Haliscomenobacter sp. TaxID=2717303 RepID=UPI0029A37BF2|nr:DUF6443 domain-containing protein [Haliscomenobacter sp.]MDX2072150.1 DUF6443 domain-containing protein [Haliscomenobacter sp.]
MFSCNRYFKFIFILITISLMGHVTDLLAQATPSIVLPSITLPNTPEASSLGKFGEGNVNTYTGALSVSIPLYSIQGKELKESIALSYDGSGNKVANLPTWVGLGWTLANGGVITRSMNGMPDLNSNYYSKADQIKPETTVGYTDQFQENDYLYSVAGRTVETEPDVYYFNFGGYSGRFYIDARKNIYQAEKKDITIQPAYGSEDITSFTIKDMMGNVYEFTATEVTDAFIECSETGQCSKARYIFNSSWYLTKVTSANGTELMEYEYETLTAAYSPPINLASNQSMTYWLSTELVSGGTPGTCCGPPQFPCGENNTTPNVQKGGFTNQTYILNRKFLSKIYYRLRDPNSASTVTTETVEFQSSTNSFPHAYGGKKLDKVTIKKGENGVTGLMEWKFTYSGSTNRLTLTTLQQCAAGTTTCEEPYSFEYNTTTLPDPTSSQIDFWGYYNSNPNLQGLIPSFTYPNNGITYPGQNANRNTDTTRVKAGILTKVTYPTKGYTQYYYQAHLVANDDGSGIDRYVGGLRIKEIKNYNYSGTLINQKYYRYIKEGSLPNDLNNSSGSLRTRLDYVSFSSSRHYPEYLITCDIVGGNCIPYPQGHEWICRFITLTATNNTSLGSEELGHVGYDRVEEIIAGKTVSYFRHGNNGLGDLSKTVTYDDQNKKLSESIYTYSNDINETRNFTSCNGYKVEQYLDQDNATTLCQSAGGGFSWLTPLQSGTNCIIQRGYGVKLRRSYYTIQQKWKYLAAKTDKQFFYDGAGILSGEVSTTTNFTYGNTKVTQPTITSVQNSDGKTYTSIVRFTENASPVQSALVTKGMFGVPVEVEEQVDGVLTKKVKVEYSVDEFPGGLVLPYRFYDKYNSSQADELQLTVQSYDKYGNLLQLQREYDQPVSALWSNYHTRMAAKVLNAAQNEVAYTSFETTEATQGNWSITGTNNIQYNGASPAKAGAGCFGTGSGSFTKTGLPIGKYILSYYSKSPGGVSVTLSGGTVLTTTTDQTEGDGWAYVERLLDCTAANASVTVNTSGALFDELRLYPHDALMTTASYDRNSCLVKAISEENNLTANFEYDALLRLLRVKDFNGDYVSSTDYLYRTASGGENTIKTRLVQTAGITTTAGISSLTGANLIDSYKFFDGLGRPVQQIDLNQSPTQKDIVSFMEYDQFGREVKKYLPYTIAETNARAIRPNAISEQQSFYTAIAEGSAYTETVLENSPLSRPKQQYLAGTSFRSKPGSTTYGTNTSNEVRNFKTSGYYAANSLMKMTATDPDGKTSITYTDKIGRTLLTVNGGEKTYTVYYDHGGVQAVLPPNASALLESNTGWTVASSTEGERLYKYTYDPNNTSLLTSKQVPGSNLQYIYYDRMDRPVLSVDGNGIKLFTKYDILNRPVITGKYNGSSLPASGNGLYESPSTSGPHYYSTTTAFPTDGLIEVYTVNYYDQYDLNRDGTLSSTDEAYSTPPSGYNLPTYRVRGKSTAVKVGQLPATGAAPTQYLLSFTYYDKKMRVVQTRGDNHLGGKDKTYQQINFPGWTLKSKREHTVGSTTTTIETTFEYDHAGRLTKTSESVNGVFPTVLSQQEYDERNLLKNKKLHQASGGGYLQTLDYTYNIQGWVSRLNDPASLGSDLFGFELVYKEGDASLDSRYASGQNANYAGNITLMKWNVQGSSNVKTYGFLYDNLNRLKEGIYAEKTSGGSYTASGNYANALTYDRDGNILTQTRTGRKGDGTFNQIDNMTYTYNSKGQLSTLRDNSDGTKGFVTPTPGTAQGYTYDNAGNLTRDEHKKITISYNALNLPRRILFDNGSQLDITYDAAGNKLKKQVIYPNGDRTINNLPIPSGTYTAAGTITSTGRVDNGSNVTFKAGTAVMLNPGFETKQGAAFLGKTETGQSANYTQDYVMGIEYQNTVMQAIYNSEGRLYFTGSTTRYEYTMTDHLGNARVSFTDQNADGVPEIIQENHYYPFGLAMEGPWMNDPAEDNKYQYNGKELNDDFGLGWMDYGARWYDASVGRWNGVDPLAEKMPSWSPFSYAFNNPLKFVDPTGMEPGLTPDPGDKDSKRDRRIRREIKKARDQALSEGREISAMEAQNIIAVENQNKRWYRHGAVRDNKAWFASKTTGGRVQTILIWQLYENIDKLAYESKADATEGSQPYNVATEVNIDPQGEFVEGSMEGEVVLTMDDRMKPDNLIVTYQTAAGPKTIETKYGSMFDPNDNVRTLKIPLAELKSTVLSVTVSNPEGGENRNAYDLTIRTVGTAERKSSKSVHAIIDRRPTRRRR